MGSSGQGKQLMLDIDGFTSLTTHNGERTEVKAPKGGESYLTDGVDSLTAGFPSFLCVPHSQ